MDSRPFFRQLDLVGPEELALPIKIIGVGGIGSPTAFILAKMGCCDITVIDNDLIEDHNLANQIYRPSDIGQPKVEALSNIIEEFSNLKIKTKAVRLNKRTERFLLEGVVVSSVDTMRARKIIWEIVKLDPSVNLYIDARMAAEVGKVYTISPCDIDQIRFYEKTLYSDAESTKIPCTARAIIYNTFLVGSLIANQIKKFVKSEPINSEIIFDLKNLFLMVEKS